MGRREMLICFGVAMLMGVAVYLKLWTIDYRITSKETDLIRRQFDLANKEAMDESAEWRKRYDEEAARAKMCANKLAEIKALDAAGNIKKLEMLQKENIDLIERIESLTQELETVKLKCRTRQT